MLQTNFSLTQTPSSKTVTTGSELGPMTQPYLPLALTLPALGIVESK